MITLCNNLLFNAKLRLYRKSLFKAIIFILIDISRFRKIKSQIDYLNRFFHSIIKIITLNFENMIR
ncbi:hypothetical protein BpHYR1_053039 [Brachionus plicatilis]|uniref:Uncharacterized protein n=1 Tax=Brachionus plicatilis TaxID=10195 RepID=A0A3M7T061_BRAPC|nr:hypothetical protein BpHYR1_053039 [Brachionus plicatilis]